MKNIELLIVDRCDTGCWTPKRPIGLDYNCTGVPRHHTIQYKEYQTAGTVPGAGALCTSTVLMTSNLVATGSATSLLYQSAICPSTTVQSSLRLFLRQYHAKT